ncbi:MAG TPA: septal ring lytic transglycosylase RlpA family protein [Terriglobia bacterium]|nr:septal ring lytic transglycosylase RlpA family protein [Terriglobia bacterium]
MRPSAYMPSTVYYLLCFAMPHAADLPVTTASPKRPSGEGRIHLTTLTAAAIVGLLLLSTGCLHRRRRHPTRPQVGAPPAKIVQNEQGIASWYGHPFHGRPTASGEIYNMHDLTAAHRTLPFSTRVRVHDLDNGRDVEVRINDRGPFVKGRIIDLSNGAARSMQMIGPGTAHVSLEILGLPSPGSPGAVPGIFAVQVGSFRNPSNAARLKAILEQNHFGPVEIQTFDRGDGIFYRVRVGRESSQEDAEALAEKVRQANLAAETFVVRLN